MTDPRRLLEGGDADLGATLLRAAQIDAPPETSRKRAAAALGLTGAPAAIGAAGGGGGAAATAAKLATTGIAIKWLGAGVAGLAMVSAASSYRAGRAQRVTPSVAVVSTAAPRVPSAAHVDIPPPEPIAPIAPIATGAPLAPVAALPPSSPSPSPAPAHSIGREVAMLDSARTALAEGHAEEAIHRLDAYARSCPDGALALEANVVRVEALEAEGKTARAATLAQQLLAKHPDAPQAAHLRSLVRELQGETDPTNP
jgi:hypothetical protein